MILERLKPYSQQIHLLGMIALFFLECEYLLRQPEHLEVRIALRALVGVPAHDILFAGIAFLILAKCLLKDKLPSFTPARFSPALLSLHLAFTVILEFTLMPLHRLSLDNPSLRYGWWFILGAYFLSWLACIIRPTDWKDSLTRHATSLTAVLAAGAVSVYASKQAAHLWYALPKATMWCTERWMKLVFDEVIRGPGKYSIGTPTFSVDVGAPCSGYEGMGLIACYLAAFLWLRRDALKFPQAFLLLPLGITISWIANTLRITALIMVGTWISPRIALDGFHSQAGWLSFTLLGLAFVVLVERAGWFRKDSTKVELTSLPYLAPLVVLFLAQIATSAFTNSFDFYYPLRVVILIFVLLHFRGAYSSILGSVSKDSVICGLGVYALWLLLAEQHPAPTPAAFLQGNLLMGWLSFRLIGSVVIIPLVEELAFRGYLLRRLQALAFDKVPMGKLTTASVLISSLVFGLFHQDWIAGTVAGACYALVLRRNGSLSDAVVAHAVTNLCLSIQVLALGQWGYW